MNALYQQNTLYQKDHIQGAGHQAPVPEHGPIEGGTNTNVIPGQGVSFKLDRRMIPEENPAEVEATSARSLKTHAPLQPLARRQGR
jgi:succinyl-diaminopimelate desuccinylase